MSPSRSRVMLVAPPGRCTSGGSFHAVPPEGVARLAAWLRQARFDVAVLDVLVEGYDVRAGEGRTVRYGLSADEAAARIADHAPQLIGLSCPFTCIESDVLDIARACHALMPEAQILLGGAHAAVCAEALLHREPALSGVALGEGELAMESLLWCVRDGGMPDQVDGFACRQADGGVVSRPRREALDLARLPMPAWDLFPLEAYARANAPHYGVGAKKRFLTTTWSRGCVHACGFCLSPRLWGVGNHRKRTVESILNEARLLQEVYGIEELHVQDDCLLHDVAWFCEVLDAFAAWGSGPRLDFSNGLDVRRMDHDTAAKLAQAGTVRMALSFDAGETTRGLRWTSKRVPLPVAVDRVRALGGRGIDVVGLFMLGFPGQTISDMHRTVEYALYLDLAALALFVVTPFPGTPLHAFCEAEGFLVKPHDSRDFRLNTGLIRTPEFGPEDTERLRREGWEEFQRRRRERG